MQSAEMLDDGVGATFRAAMRRFPATVTIVTAQDGIGYGTQNNLGPSIPASQRATPMSRRVLSLRFINSRREWARRRQVPK
jgi:hypothetical protein